MGSPKTRGGGELFRFDVTLTLRAPILVHATEPSPKTANGIDATCLRDRTTGRLMLPRTLVKGRLFQAHEELLAVNQGAKEEPFDPEVWYGKAAGVDPSGRFAASPGSIRISDFLDVDPGAGEGESDGERCRITLDADLGAASDKALQVLELPYAAGQPVRFEGRIELREASDKRDQVRKWLSACFLWNEQFGAYRGVGFGTVVSVEVKDAQDPKPASRPAAAPGSCRAGALPAVERIGLRILPEGPLCLARESRTDNLFVSSDMISGSAVKGALAAAWNRRLGLRAAAPIDEATHGDLPELARSFSRLRILHAFPCAEGSDRPERPPLSLVSAGGKVLYDAAFLPGPTLFEVELDKVKHWVAPAFAPDWKPDARARAGELAGWAEPRRELRTRTRIDRKLRRAQENQLFTYEMVLPEGVQWRTELDLGLVDPRDRGRVSDQLLELLEGGLERLGKTQERARVGLVDTRAFSPIDGPGPWAVRLQTDALLADPTLVRVDDPDSIEQGLELAYKQSWQALLADPGARLVRWFTGETLAGGQYLHLRFRKSGATAYRPFLVTEAGSTFVLEGLSEAGWARLAELERHGLPLTRAVAEAHGSTWHENPFLRENGFAEITVSGEPWRSLAPPANAQPVFQ